MKVNGWITALLLATVQFAPAQPNPGPADRIRALNQELTAPGAQPRPGRVRDLVRLRLSVLTELAQSDPSAALSLLLPEVSLAPLRTLAPDIAAGLEAEGEWSGPVEVVAEDDFEHHSSKTHVSMQTGGERLDVYAAGQPGSLRSGDRIEVVGVRLGRTILVRKLTVAVQPAASGCSSIGVQHLAVVMVNFASSSIDTSTVNSASIEAIISGATHNLTGYWNEASYGQTSAAADVYGPFNLGADYTGSDYNAIETAAINAAATTGNVTFGNYTHVVIVMPNGFPTGGGLGTIGCASLTSPTTGPFIAGVVWLRADFLTPNDVGVCGFAHENGHNLGLNHASTESYGSVPLGSFGTVPVHNEYGSFFSLMSECFTYNNTTLLGHYDAQHKVSLGWWAPSNYQTVSANGNFVLAPTESATGSLHAIRVQRGQENNFWLWLEYRQPTGYDSTFAAYSGQIYSGAMIHFEDPTNTTYAGYTRLLNYTAPANANFSEPSLAAGSSWSDPYSLLTLNVTSADSAGLHVTVHYDTPCATLSPSSRTYSSSAAVAGDTVTLTASGPCSWTGISNASWITVTNGSSGSGSGSLTYSLTANATASPRTGTITIARQAFTITQASANPQPTPVSVTPSGSSSPVGAYQTFTMSYSDAAGAASLAEASVLFNTSTSQTAACSISWHQSNNSVRLFDDADDGYEYVLANQNGLLSNSQCTVSSNAVATSGNNLTLTLNIKFTASFAGVKNIYLEAQDGMGADSGTVALGTWSVPSSPCDVNQDGITNAADVQKMVNEAIGASAATNDLNHDGKVNILDIQIVTNAALGSSCSGS